VTLLALGADATTIHNAIIDALEHGHTEAIKHIEYVCSRSQRKLLHSDLKHIRELFDAGADHEEIAALYIAQYGTRQLELPTQIKAAR